MTNISLDIDIRHHPTMSLTPLSMDNPMQCNRSDRPMMSSKYVPQLVPQRKQSVFVAPSGLNSLLPPAPPRPQPPPAQPSHHNLPPPPSLSHNMRRPLFSPPITSVQNAAAIPTGHTAHHHHYHHQQQQQQHHQRLSLPHKSNAQMLEQRISSKIDKLISENAAIVEPMNPLWSKRYISRNSTSAAPSMSSLNGMSMNAILANESIGTGGHRRYSEQPLSKLQSALLGKASTAAASAAHPTSPPIRKYSEFSLSESTQQSVIINAKDTNNNNNNNFNNKIHFNTFNNHNNNNNSNESQQMTASDSIVRNLLTTKTPAIQVSPPAGKSSPPANGGHPQNPEGSIIKDLLLKSRDEAQQRKSRVEGLSTAATTTATGPTAPVVETESSMLVYVCTVCNIAFRNKENLEVHQVHYCKGNPELSNVRSPSGNKQKLDSLVQRKVSMMARPGAGYGSLSGAKHGSAGYHSHPKQSVTQKLSTGAGPAPPIGNILKQQLLAPNQGPPLKKRKISEPVFRSSNAGHSSLASMPDIQIIEEHSVRRISVVQSPHQSSHTTPATAAVTIANTSPIYTTKSSQSATVAADTTPPAGTQLPITLSSSHTVIQPVLHSGATVIENNYLYHHNNNNSHHKSAPICYYNVSGAGRTPTQMSTSTQQQLQPVLTDLVSGHRPAIEILPAYMPHLQRPTTKITFKGPIVFPVLKNQLANQTNHEFQVDETGVTADDYNDSSLSSERKMSAITNTTMTTTCPFRQVASLPQTPPPTPNDYNNTSNDSNSCKDDDNSDEDMEIVDKDKENDKQMQRVSSPVNGIIRTTGAIRPNTLSLRTNNGSNLVSSTLVSPDTPRPNKTCVQLYMNGHAYSRIGLKVTPRPVYCTIYKTQPMFIQQETDPNLSMYSNWTTSPLSPDDVMHLASPAVILGLYNSSGKQRVDSMVMCNAMKGELNPTHSSYWRFRQSDEEKENLKDTIARMRQEVGDTVEEVYRKFSEEVSASSAYSGDTDSDGGGGDANPPKRVRIFEGGFKSNEDYTYVRGRGRGKYVCEECGIRCKKPSMLKKHIRTHTDLRPYSCRHCAFAFKTKGNLTKHMKSKAHHKKCVELGIIPVPITIDDSQIDTDALAKQEMLEITCGNLPEDEDDDEDEGEWDEDEEEEDDEGVPIPWIQLQRMAPTVSGQFDDADGGGDGRARTVSESGSNATEAEEQEAARSLLILSASGSEPDLTTPRKSSTISVNEDIVVNSPEKRKVSVIDRRISQQMLDNEKMRRVSHHMMEVEQQRRISQHLSPTIKPMACESIDVHMSTPMKPPNESPPPMMSSPRKLSPIEQLQQQVHQQQQQHLLQTTWTPNCDQMSRPRSYSFNDVPLMPSNHHNPYSTTGLLRPSLVTEPIEPISEESSDESMDAYALRRYSMSVIAERSKTGVSGGDREEPMDLSLSTKPSEGVPTEDRVIVFPSMKAMANGCGPGRMPIVAGMPGGLRHGEFIPKAPQHVIQDSIDGKSICSVCSKQFSKPSQLRLHENIHYFERPFKCDSCAVSFRTKGHLQKHKRSVSHFNKVTINSTFGTPTTDNPRPFKCADCKIAFRIHGHLAKHLRSKMHIMKLECLGKLPFGMYAEMERSGLNLNEIDTTDCDNSLHSLQLLAQRLYDPRQMRWASEPIPDNHNDNNSYDDNPHVKNESKDSPIYHSLADRQRQPTPSSLPTTVTSQQPLPPPPPLLTNNTRLSSQLSPNNRHPSSPPPPPNQTPKSPPIPSQRQTPQQPSPPPPPIPAPQQAVPAPVVPQQQSGFTSTRSNTCHLCGQTFKGAKFLQVHLYCDHNQ